MLLAVCRASQSPGHGLNLAANDPDRSGQRLAGERRAYSAVALYSCPRRQAELPSWPRREHEATSGLNKHTCASGASSIMQDSILELGRSCEPPPTIDTTRHDETQRDETHCNSSVQSLTLLCRFCYKRNYHQQFEGSNILTGDFKIKLRSAGLMHRLQATS